MVGGGRAIAGGGSRTCLGAAFVVPWLCCGGGGARGHGMAGGLLACWGDSGARCSNVAAGVESPRIVRSGLYLGVVVT
jgi:hypothetical protein